MKTKEGLILLQINPEIAVELRNNEYYGWLFKRGPEGNWVTVRKLEEWEIMQAEDQRESQILIDACNKEDG